MTAPPAEQVAERLALAAARLPEMLARRDEKRAQRAAHASRRADREGATARARGARRAAITRQQQRAERGELGPVATERMRRGFMTQATLATRAGLSLSAVKAAEADPGRARSSTRWKIASALGTTPMRLWPDLFA